MKSMDFQHRIMKYAPVDTLPQTVLLRILAEAAASETCQDDKLKLLPPNIDDSLLVAEVLKYRKYTSLRERAQQFAKATLAARLYIVAIAISYVDLAGDVAVGVSLVWSKSNPGAGYTTLALTVGSLVVQALLSIAMGQGPGAALAALVGAKPLLDVYNLLSKRPLTRGRKEDHVMAFTATRGEEVVLQALPQGFYQCLVVLQMAAEGETPSWVQAASIAGALVSVAFIVADTDRSVDTGAHYRLNHGAWSAVWHLWCCTHQQSRIASCSSTPYALNTPPHHTQPQCMGTYQTTSDTLRSSQSARSCS